MSNLENGYPEHIAIIMDGNRRWARKQNLAVKEGHKRGAETLEKIAKYCNKIGIKYLTVYAFSTENWKRSKEEVGALMLLLKNYLSDFSKRADTENIKIKVLGDISPLDKGLQKSIEKAIERTKANTGLTLNIAFNYGGRDEITRAVKAIATKVKNNEINIDDIDIEKSEVADVKWVNKEEFDYMLEKGEVIQTLSYFKKLYSQIVKKRHERDEER